MRPSGINGSIPCAACRYEVRSRAILCDYSIVVIRGLAKAESRVRIPLVAYLDTYSNHFLKMIEDPRVASSNLARRLAPVAQLAERRTIDVSSLWLCSVAVIASACHAEDHEFDSRQGRFHLISGVRQLGSVTRSCSR